MQLPWLYRKRNDQIRFELGAYALNPDIEIIAPWRTWDFKSRNDLIDYAEQNKFHYLRAPETNPRIQLTLTLHISYEGGILEDPWVSPPEEMEMDKITRSSAQQSNRDSN